MKLVHILAKGWDIGADFRAFLTQPRQYVRARLLGTESKPLGEILAWSIGTGALIWGLYSWVGGSPPFKLERALGIAPGTQVEAASAPAGARVQLRKVFWQTGFSIGVDFPEAMAKGWSVPQPGVFQMGTAGVILDNVEPMKLGGIAGKLMLLLYALVTVTSLHLPARIAGARTDFHQELRLGCVFYSYVALLAMGLVVLGSVTLIDLAHLRRAWIVVGWPALVVIPTFAIAFRCFFAAFSELYSVSKKRLMLIGLGSAVVSSILSPVVFVPLIYLLLRFRDLLEVIV